MKLFKGGNFSELYYEMLEFAFYEEVPLIESRVGAVRDYGPAYYELRAGDSRLVYLNGRNLNPFFALAEFAWIISGSKALKPLRFFIKTYDQYSDDGRTLHGAYGFRLRHYFGVDQIEESIRLLRDDSTSRRVVLTIWSADDLAATSRDLPCHTTVYLKIRQGALDLTVLNRSNDLYLGVPYDILVFHLLQLYFADRIGCEVGLQRHFVDSFHLYEIHLESVKNVLDSTNKSAIPLVRHRLQEYDFSHYIRTNTDKVTSLEFSEIRDSILRSFFNSYVAYEGSRDFKKSLELLPQCTLGYAAYLWYRSRKDFPNHSKITEYEELVRMVGMTDNLELLDSVKYQDEEGIKSFVENMAHKFKDRVDDLLRIVQEDTLFTLNKTEEERLVKALFLSLALTTITSNLYNPFLKEELIQKFRNVSKRLDIPYSDLVRLTQYEDRLRQIII